MNGIYHPNLLLAYWYTFRVMNTNGDPSIQCHRYPITARSYQTWNIFQPIIHSVLYNWDHSKNYFKVEDKWHQFVCNQKVSNTRTPPQQKNRTKTNITCWVPRKENKLSVQYGVLRRKKWDGGCSSKKYFWINFLGVMKSKINLHPEQIPKEMCIFWTADFRSWLKNKCTDVFSSSKTVINCHFPPSLFCTHLPYYTPGNLNEELC